ncbi:MAG: hypothetical protein H6736_23315 [Alphaproteobacteria bacterium]|nr:hypothetical protein [Alphaproteobacteria bacterium]
MWWDPAVADVVVGQAPLSSTSSWGRVDRFVGSDPEQHASSVDVVEGADPAGTLL